MKTAQKIALEYYRKKLKLIAAVSITRAAEQAFKLFCTPQRKAKKNISPVIKKAERLSIKVNDYMVYGYRWNHPSAQKLLIAHGFESSAQNFEGFVTPLINKGYEIIAFDAPAHGDSEGKQIVLPLYIDMLRAVSNTFGPFQAYIAHSFGGLALMHVLESMPQNENVKAVLIAPATEITSVIDRFFRLIQLNIKVRTVFDELSAKVTGMTFQQASGGSIIKNIKANILWFHDTEDDVTPFKDAEKIKNMHLPNIEFVVSKGLGHRRIYRDQHTVNKVLHFL